MHSKRLNHFLFNLIEAALAGFQSWIYTDRKCLYARSIIHVACVKASVFFQFRPQSRGVCVCVCVFTYVTYGFFLLSTCPSDIKPFDCPASNGSLGN